MERQRNRYSRGIEEIPERGSWAKGRKKPMRVLIMAALFGITGAIIGSRYTALRIEKSQEAALAQAAIDDDTKCTRIAQRVGFHKVSTADIMMSTRSIAVRCQEVLGFILDEYGTLSRAQEICNSLPSGAGRIRLLSAQNTFAEMQSNFSTRCFETIIHKTSPPR